jgi:predicted CDP-diglyceride synthetase/phosphatidate cytidylyltransferase
MRGPRVTTAYAAAPAPVLLAVAWAQEAGAAEAVFYLFLLGIPVSAAAGLIALDRLVSSPGAQSPLRRLEAMLAGFLVAVFVLGAAARSPFVLELQVPGLAGAALALGFCVLALQALAGLAPVRR